MGIKGIFDYELLFIVLLVIKEQLPYIVLIILEIMGMILFRIRILFFTYLLFNLSFGKLLYFFFMKQIYYKSLLIFKNIFYWDISYRISLASPNRKAEAYHRRCPFAYRGIPLDGISYSIILILNKIIFQISRF